MYTQCRLSICMCQVYAHINKTYMEYRMVSNNTMPMCRSIKTIDLPKLGMAHQFLGVIRSIANLRLWKAFQWGSVSSKGHSSSISRWFFGLDLLQFSNYFYFFRSPQGPDYSCRIWMGQFAGHLFFSGKINEMVSGGFLPSINPLSLKQKYPLVI